MGSNTSTTFDAQHQEGGKGLLKVLSMDHHRHRPTRSPLSPSTIATSIAELNESHPCLLNRDSQWSKSSPALKPTRPYRLVMRSSKSVPNISEKVQPTTSIFSSHDSSTTTSTTTTTTTSSSINNQHQQQPHQQQEQSLSPNQKSYDSLQQMENSPPPPLIFKPTPLSKTKGRPTSKSHATFMKQPPVMFTDEWSQNKYFDKYYPTHTPIMEEKIKTMDVKARPKHYGTRSQSAANLKISAPSESGFNTNFLPAAADSLQPHQPPQNILHLRPVSPIIALYNKNPSPHNGSIRTASISPSNSVTVPQFNGNPLGYTSFKEDENG